MENGFAPQLRLESTIQELSLYIHELATHLLAEANHQLEYLASCDGLTGVANRHRYNQYLDYCWQQHIGGNSVLSLIMCDVDFFKRYNDTYGHQGGDECWQKVADAIQGAVR